MELSPQLAVLVLLLGFMSCACGHNITLQEHFSRVHGFKCDVPHLTAVSLAELPVQVTGKKYLPEVTVLHRCHQGTGCCPNIRQSCGPADTELVSLPFQVTFVIEVPGHRRYSSLVEHLMVVNHTRCRCFDPSEPPR